MNGDPAGWNGPARALLETAVRRHGGWEAWRSLRALEVRPRLLNGMLPWLKGFGRTFPLPPRAEVSPHEGRAIFHDYPTPGATGTFERGRLTLTDAGGAVTLSADNGRNAFRGWGKLRRWSPAGALYFFGYALTHSLLHPRPEGRGQPASAHRRVTPVQQSIQTTVAKAAAGRRTASRGPRGLRFGAPRDPRRSDES
ncbi:MAG TPA: hypothetical protein VMT03_17080 [Polyangia bacterium]|nr:hypothetical protein [Polyangia bacterium]